MKAFTIDYNPERYEKGKERLESIKNLDEREDDDIFADILNRYHIRELKL